MTEKDDAPEYAKERHDQIVEILHAKNLDIVCLQEVSSKLAVKLQQEFSDHYCYYSPTSRKKSAFGVMLISKLEPIEVEKIRLFKLIDCDGLPDEEVRLIKNKPTTSIFAQYDGFAICICHLPKLKYDPIPQKKFLDAFLGKSATYVNPILCGDFNLIHCNPLLETIPYPSLDYPEYTFYDHNGKHTVFDRVYTNLPIKLHPMKLHGPAPNEHNPSDHYPVVVSVDV